VTSPKLTGKRVLITGAARGIGRALAARMLADGARLILTDVDEEAGRQTAAELGADIAFHALDITDPEAIRLVHERVCADGGQIDVLVNNAGVVRGGAFLAVPLDAHRQTFEVNTLGMVAMTHAFLGDLIASPTGHLINIVSASAYVGLPLGTTYAASKWGALGFSESIRLELAQLGHDHVHVTAVCPSFVDTKMFDGAKTPVTTRMLTPDKLADKVVRAMHRDAALVHAPFLVWCTPILRGLLPGKMFDWVARRLGAYSSMENWRGHSR